MNKNRRHFIKTASALGTGLVLTLFATKLTGCKSPEASPEATPTAETQPFGLQLYTLRDDFPKDPKGVLKQVSDLGYTQVEGYEGDQGIFWGMKNTELKSYLDSIGLTMVSTHCDMNTDFERKADEAAAIGMKYLICPYLGRQENMDFYKKAAERFNQCGEICNQRGLRFAYHNHDYSFKPIDGQLPQDVMMSMTGDNVDYEMDIYWVVMADQDPIAWINKYPGRFTLCHVKDRGTVAGQEQQFESVVLGKGSIDYNSLLQQLKQQGMQYFIVEQEAYTGTTPLDAAKANAEFMRNVKI